MLNITTWYSITSTQSEQYLMEVVQRLVAVEASFAVERVDGKWVVSVEDIDDNATNLAELL